MSEVYKELLVPYSATKMYNLVNDINKYPEFLPWCTSANIIAQEDEEIQAKLQLAYAGFKHEFTTCNKLDPSRKIDLKLVNGPFKYLSGQWVFTDINNNGSKVELKLDFEFDNPILAFTFGKFFKQVANELVEHFYKRAQVVYGS